MLTLWQRLFSGKQGSSCLTLAPIEVFSRQCISSSVSQHKKRLPEFSREACYRNLIDTWDAQKGNLTFFLDTAKGSRSAHFLPHSEKVIEIQAGTEADSFLQLLDYVEKLALAPETIVYFVEDDYLHRDGWTDVLLEGLQIPGVDYVTLYDHRDKYFFPQYAKLQSKIFATASCHWRTTPSTTNTFAARYATLMQDLSIHRRFSRGRTITADHDKFCYLRKQGRTLISSIPGWSTHAEPEYTSPIFSWDQLLKTPIR